MLKNVKIFNKKWQLVGRSNFSLNLPVKFSWFFTCNMISFSAEQFGRFLHPAYIFYWGKNWWCHKWKRYTHLTWAFYGISCVNVLRWLPRVSTKVTIRAGKSYKRNPSSVVLQSLFLTFASKVTNIITLIFQFLLLRHRLLSWQQNV